MSVNWNWKDKIGFVAWKSNEPMKKGFRWNIYRANCLCCMIYEYKEEGKEYYRFQCWFNDKEHLQRCLGLKGKEKTDLFKDWYLSHHIKYIKLNMYYKECEVLMKYFTMAGYQIRTYYQEPKE